MLPTVTSGISCAPVRALFCEGRATDRWLRLHPPLVPNVVLTKTCQGVDISSRTAPHNTGLQRLPDVMCWDAYLALTPRPSPQCA